MGKLHLRFEEMTFSSPPKLRRKLLLLLLLLLLTHARYVSLKDFPFCPFSLFCLCVFIFILHIEDIYILSSKEQ